MNKTRGSNQYKNKYGLDYKTRSRIFMCLLFALVVSYLGNLRVQDENFRKNLISPLADTASYAVEVTPTPYQPNTEKQKIYHYLLKVFGDHASDAIAIIRVCENGSFNPRIVSKPNKNGTVDVGVMQINVKADNFEEIERLKDYKYNIDKGYAKWRAGDGGKHKNSFYLWTCGKVINQYTYVDRLNGR